MTLNSAIAMETHSQPNRGTVIDGRTVLEKSRRRAENNWHAHQAGKGGRLRSGARHGTEKMVHEMAPALRGRLPLGFRQLDYMAHGDYDQIALDAGSLKNVSNSFNQLSAKMRELSRNLSNSNVHA